jgi:two-component system KDP operon response regulator KdpE
MILIVSHSPKEAELLAALCNHRTWPCYHTTTVRRSIPLIEKIRPRAIVVRHRLVDGYSDDLVAHLGSALSPARPRIIVLMAADRTIQAEARQIGLGADCVLHDPVNLPLLMEYLGRFRGSSTAPRPPTSHSSFNCAGVEVHPVERRISLQARSIRVAPKEIEFLQILTRTPGVVVPYPVLYADLFGRQFSGESANCRVLLGKTAASFRRLGVDLRKSIQVIPKFGYLYKPVGAAQTGTPTPSLSRTSKRPRRAPRRAKTNR